ncbi:MAG: recombinase family protein [Candidatus Methylomirabilis sp.]|nr:recombinase family protein [Candidatus Methylomirabilis sp.]
MSKQRPPQITPVHLAEVAAIYVRVATKPQAHESTGSIESQRNQRLYALAWGWSADQIQLYEDLGRSGTRADNRPAFQRLLTRVRGGQIGAIFCLDAARLSRAPLALEELVALCHLQRTLLVLDGTLEPSRTAREVSYDGATSTPDHPGSPRQGRRRLWPRLHSAAGARQYG